MVENTLNKIINKNGVHYTAFSNKLIAEIVNCKLIIDD